jgi:hypothetical protein
MSSVSNPLNLGSAASNGLGGVSSRQAWEAYNDHEHINYTLQTQWDANVANFSELTSTLGSNTTPYVSKIVSNNGNPLLFCYVPDSTEQQIPNEIYSPVDGVGRWKVVQRKLFIASPLQLGLVKVDNSSITISNGGVISAATVGKANSSNLGTVRPDNTTININSSGVITASAYAATSTILGHVRPDNVTIGINAGVLNTINAPATDLILGHVIPDNVSTVVNAAGAISVRPNVTLESITLANTLLPTINYPSGTVGSPTLTNRSPGSRIVLSPNLNNNLTDFAIGLESNAMWLGLSDTSSQLKIYSKNNEVASISGFGVITATSGVTTPNVKVPGTNLTDAGRVFMLDSVGNSFSVGPYYTNYNYAANQDINFWQRSNLPLTITAAVALSARADNIAFEKNSTGTVVYSRQNHIVGDPEIIAEAGYQSAYFARFEQTIAGSGSFNNIKIPSYDLRLFSSKKMVMSVCLRSASSSQVTLNYRQEFDSPTPNLNGTASTFSLTPTWKRYYIAFDCPSIFSKLLGTYNNLSFIIGAPVTGNWQIDMSAIKIETDVTFPTKLDPYSMSETLNRCRLLYQKSYELEIVPGTNFAGIANSPAARNLFQVRNQTVNGNSPIPSNVFVTTISYPTPLQFNPVFIPYDPAGNFNRIQIADGITDPVNTSTFNLGNAGTKSIVMFTITPTIANGFIFHWTAEAAI